MKLIDKMLGRTAETTILSRAERRRQTVHKAKVGECLGVIERDGIPLEVANAMLFTPGTKLSTSMLKNCMAARETVYVSTREGKEYTSRLRQKAKKATAAQLLKWAIRTVTKRAEVTRHFLKVSINKNKLDPMKLHEIAKANRILAAIDIKAQQLDAQMASYRSEAERRLIAADVFNPVR